MITNNCLIFISIASYRDSQLVATVEDLLAKAHEPALVRFGICWQHGEEEPPLPFGQDARFRIIDVDWRASRGACWARSEIMKLWAGEQWFLQVDSHCRFVAGWDTKLIRMAGQTGSPKPILSTYAGAFTPAPAASQVPEMLSGPPQLIAIENFTEEGIPKLKPLAMLDAPTRTRPVAARFLGAGLLFAPGCFVEEVPYDPELYFFGEEISMTLRAFTSGYDLFHPVENIAWHDYVRAYAIRHWDDHAPADSATDEGTSTWTKLDALSQQKVHQLLYGYRSEDQWKTSVELPGRFGLGSTRTLQEFEEYAGISFRLRKIQDYTRYAYEPPNPPSAADWPDRIYAWLVRVAVDASTLPIGSLEERSIWVVAIQDEDRREIRRHDFRREELTVNGDEAQIVIICEIQSGIIPAYWSLRLLSRFGDGTVRLEGALAETDFSIVTD